jgi:phage baseplate assembly protein V
VSGHAISELDRRLANIVRQGTITELDDANARVKVDIGDLVTDWLPFHAARAGEDRTWHAPEPGEQVTILSPSGELSQGTVIPGIYQTKYDAPGNVRTKSRTEFKDGAFIEYDRDGHKHVIDVPAGGSITLHIGGTTLKLEDGQTTLTTPKLLVDSPDSTFTGAVTVQGLLTYVAGMQGSGGSSATAAIQGNVVVTGGDVKADNISLKTHKTSGVQPGPGTSNVPVP